MYPCARYTIAHARLTLLGARTENVVPSKALITRIFAFLHSGLDQHLALSILRDRFLPYPLFIFFQKPYTLQSLMKAYLQKIAYKNLRIYPSVLP